MSSGWKKAGEFLFGFCAAPVLLFVLGRLAAGMAEMWFPGAGGGFTQYARVVRWLMHPSGYAPVLLLVALLWRPYSLFAKGMLAFVVVKLVIWPMFAA